MRKLAMTLASSAFLATGAWADISINIPAVAIPNTGTAADSIAVNTGSGLSSYHSSVAKSLPSVPGDGSLKYAWDVKYAKADGNYSSTAGLLVPLTPSWDTIDMSAMTSISFDIKCDGCVAADGVAFNLIITGADLPPEFAKYNVAFQLMAKYNSPGIPVTSSWKTIEKTVDEFIPSFFCVDHEDCKAIMATTDYASTSKKVQALNFQPILGWKDSATLNSNAKGTIYIRNIKVVGADEVVFHAGTCTGKSYTLDDFSGSYGNKGQSRQGGYWFAMSDTNSKKPTDKATGASQVLKIGTDSVWMVQSTGAILNAKLEKNVGTVWHDYAGWAGLGLTLASKNDKAGAIAGVDATGLKAISFDLYTGTNIDTKYAWSDLVPYINLKVGTAGTPDSATHFAAIPASLGDGSNVCINVSDIKMPTYVKGPTALDVKKLTQLVWEAKIRDQKSSAIHTAGPLAFEIGNVTFWGTDSIERFDASGTGIRNRVAAANGLTANYSKNLVVSYKVSGPSATVSVVGLDGATIASFQTASVAKNVSLPVSLAHGTYMVVVRGDKAGPLVQSIAVSR